MKSNPIPTLRHNQESHRTQQEFIARGLTLHDAARKSGVYFSSEEVLAELDAIIVDTSKHPPKAVVAVRHQREDDYH